MTTPEIIGLNQLPVAAAETVTGDAMLVGVIDGKDVQIRASLLGVEGGEPPEGAVTSVAGKTGEVELVKADVGLDRVDNTADADKPLSSAVIARFEAIEGALGQIDPDAGFNPENIIGRTEFEQAQAAQTQALQAVQESIPSTEGFVTGQQLTDAVSGLVTGEQLAAALEGVQSPDLSGLVTTEGLATALTPYAKTEDLPAAPDLSALATKEELAAYVKTEDLPAAPDLSGLVTQEQLTAAIGDIAAPDLSGLATTQALQALSESTSQALQTLGESIPSVEGLVTEQGLTTALAPYAKTEDIPAAPDLSNLVTNDGLTTALTPYAKTEDIPPAPDLSGLVTTEGLTTALAPYAKTEDIPAAPDLSGLATTEALQAVQQSIPSIEGLATTTDVTNATNPIAQAVQLLIQGLDTARLFWVNSGTDIETGRDGSIRAPFRQIQEALDALTPMTQSFVLLVVPTNAGANYEPFTADGFTNVTIQGFGCVDSHSVRIDGKNQITGATATRFRIKDLSMWNNDVNEPALVINTPLNRHFFQNVTIQAIGGTTVPIVDVQGDASNWLDWNECNISGRIKLAASTHNAIFAMRDSNSDTCHIESDGGWKIRVANATRMGSVDSIDDQVELTNVVGWTGKAGVAVKHASNTRPLTMHGCNLQKPDNTWLSVEKTGTADYQLSAENVNPTIGVWNGINRAYARPSSYYQPVPEFTLVDFLQNGDNLEGIITAHLNGYPGATLRLQLDAETGVDQWDPLLDTKFAFTQPNFSFNAALTQSGSTATRVRLTISDEFNPSFNPFEVFQDVVQA